MGKTWMAGILMATTFIWAAPPSVAQDKGKTEAAKLASRVAGGPGEAVQQRAACQAAQAEGAGHSGFPDSHESRPRGRWSVWRRLAAEERDCRRAYYKTTGASFGLQAGGQKYGYAMFFMNAKALDEFVNANGFEVGVGPSVVLVDEGMAKTTTTSTLKDDIYAFVFGQKGLMAGLGIQGNKITKITPK